MLISMTDRVSQLSRNLDRWVQWEAVRADMGCRDLVRCATDSSGAAILE